MDVTTFSFISELTRTCHKMYLYQEFKTLFLSILIFLGFLIEEAFSEKDITINVIPGTEECFYESLKIGQVFDIDYQVIDGGQGSLDISFYLKAPSGRSVVMDYKKPENTHRLEIEEEGDYMFCFDNKFSSFNAKTVYFEIIIESEDGTDVDLLDIINEELSPTEEYEVAIQDIEESVKKVTSHLLKIRHLQEDVRAFATRDANILNGNFFKVNSWSIIQIILMLAVGFVQVVMVKSLFDEQSKLHKFWSRTCS